jgi:3-(3-hydroxy-phenyl)propionate hydroxylase
MGGVAVQSSNMLSAAALKNAHHPVIIAGGGPVGLTCAALLASYGIASLVIEADTGYCSGSRAICVSRRSQDIMGWCGADAALTGKGLPWTGGRSYYRDTEVLHFEMPHDDSQRFAPMVNIQQYYIEQFAHEAGQRSSTPPHIAWGHSVQTVTTRHDGATLTVTTPSGENITLSCDWLIACDGGRSAVREQLGVQFEGMQYEGKYVIVDIEQATQRPTERLAWFDPPSNPGSTILMHRQPDSVWRIDYQIGDYEDPLEAVKPENVLPRVQSHLDMIGETAPWTPLWISLYNAKCLTLPDYRPAQGNGRVFFAGDAAHMVPIFGVRGLNSGIDDVGNLAWKLAMVMGGKVSSKASDALLNSYSTERVAAARENIAYGAKSTEFMAPPHRGFELMRRAALRLALESPTVRSLINPRQSLPVEYVGSTLNHGAGLCNLRPGMVAPDAPFKHIYLSTQFGQQFTLLHFGGSAAAPLGVGTVDDLGIVNIAVLNLTQHEHPLAWQRYTASEGLCVLVRPDGYVMALWASPSDVNLNAALERLHA